MDDAAITNLLAEREIAEQLLNYCRGIDRLDRELLRSVWHIDGTAAYSGNGLPIAVADFIDEVILRHEALDFHHHNLTQPLIHIVGEKAVSEANVVALLRKGIAGAGDGAEGPWRDEHLRLRFLDRWSWRNGRWAIDHRIVVPTLAWEQSSSGMTGGLSRRDRTDPVYDHLSSLGGEGVFATRVDGLSELRAERDIRRQLATYSRGVDRFDPDIWKTFWHPDATLRYEAVALDAVAHDIPLTMTLGHYPWAAHQHQSTRAAIRICGDRAVSETLNFSMLHGYMDSSGLAMQDHFRGRYLDTWERRDGRWAIKHRFTPRGGVWQQAVESVVGAFMRRDRSDPSYMLFASLEKGEPDDLTILASEQAIRTAMQIACRALDRLDLVLLQALWWPTGRLVDRTRGLDGNASKLNELLIDELANFAGSAHHTTLTAIDINCDQAVSETYFENTLIPYSDEEGVTANRHVRGRYLDRWSRREGRWGLDHREILLDFAWEHKVPADCMRYRPQRELPDLSYELFTGEFALVD